MLKNNKQIAITILLLVFVIAFFQLTDSDIYIQSFFYDFESKTWLIDKNEPILKFFFYDGLKNLLLLFGLLILLSLIFLRKKALFKSIKRV